MAEGVGDNDFSWLVEPIATGIELFGVAVILLTVAIATLGYLLALRTTDYGPAYRDYRARLGRGFCLGWNCSSVQTLSPLSQHRSLGKALVCSASWC